MICLKVIFDNVKNNYLVKYAFIIFVIQCIFSFYNSIRLDSIDLLISGVVENTYKFLILYALGVIIKKEKR